MLTLDGPLPKVVPAFPKFEPLDVRMSDGGYLAPDCKVAVARYDILGQPVCVQRYVSRRLELNAVDIVDHLGDGQRSIESMLVREWEPLVQYWPAFPFPSELFRQANAEAHSVQTKEASVTDN